MNWDLIHTILLFWILDRQLIHRRRYKLAIETEWSKYYKWIGLWIYSREPHQESFYRYKRIFWLGKK